MRVSHIIGGTIAVVILFLIGTYFMVLNFIVSGECFPND